MPYPIEKKLVVAVSSTALFDFAAEHDLYLKLGVEEFRAYQREHRAEIPERGAAFPFIQRLLNLNSIYSDEHPIEVVILSRNHADAGLRVMDAVTHYELEISRSFFLAGQLPYPYMQSIGAVLYLSTNKDEVKAAVQQGFPAGYVLPCESLPVEEDKQLRIAFDFDGVIADDEAEVVYKDSGNLDMFHEHERKFKDKPLHAGPLMPLLLKISEFQKLEREKAQNMDEYTQMLRIAILTARNAPAHERLINTLSESGIDVDELFLLGGIEKKLVLDVLKPHIFFDDQIGHLTTASTSTPSVHIPFGIANYGG
jgi:5'-nucleotidase